ncbi:hypothetical protein LK07_13955 [Streptomyces pluripotens]|uniref:Peptide synthetase n=1 Tax=Streptomyces pluripotens TaxID=1355015 RepID=A0A221NYJ0_9ACTN|nr:MULTISPECIES: hypothetical protein [Streptomyces]ARP70702.1 hypothetical protein LK06_012825 [Streptomyces pluripotens]ASN24964.1 hypothetical protein LK07_13955 [Streptomyces pluripotens]KIE27434.1 hypothetical protein LK08_08700 [Streptomyces sp. MUSC 125]MCH0556600.1 hypothetical protein [Streptomyces sp. MUM 16J]
MTDTETASTTRPYTRRLSQIERGYLNAAATGTPQLIQMVVEGEGRIEVEALREAVRVATLASPGLAVRRRAASWRADGPIPPVVELPPHTDSDAPFFHRDLDVRTGPVCEVGLVDGPSTRLVVRASHIVTDGRGLRQWIADVFRVLRGEDPVGADSVVDDTHFRAAAGEVPPAEPPARLTGLPAILGQGPADGTPLWIRRRVRAAPSAVTARVAAALSRHLAADAGRLIIPVDLRRHDRTIRSTANLTSQLVLDIRREDNWRRLHGQVVRALLGKREIASLGRDFLRSNPFANSLREARELDGTRFPCTAIITDHGRVDTAELSTGGFTATAFYTLPMLVPYAEMFLSTCQIGDETELTLSCRERPGAREAGEAVLDDVERALTDAL